MKLGTWEIVILILIPVGIYLLGYFHGKARGAKITLEKQLKNNKEN